MNKILEKIFRPFKLKPFHALIAHDSFTIFYDISSLARTSFGHRDHDHKFMEKDK